MVVIENLNCTQQELEQAISHIQRQNDLEIRKSRIKTLQTVIDTAMKEIYGLGGYVSLESYGYFGANERIERPTVNDPRRRSLKIHPPRQ